MVDLTEQERAALRAAMRAMAEVMAEIGWTTPLNALSEEQVLTLAEVPGHPREARTRQFLQRILVAAPWTEPTAAPDDLRIPVPTAAEID